MFVQGSNDFVGLSRLVWVLVMMGGMTILFQSRGVTTSEWGERGNTEGVIFANTKMLRTSFLR